MATRISADEGVRVTDFGGNTVEPQARITGPDVAGKAA